MRALRVAAAVLAAWLAATSVHAKDSSDLQQLRRDLQSSRERLQETTRDERRLLVQLEGLDLRMAEIEAQRSGATERARDAGRRWNRLGEQSKAIALRVEEAREAMRGRVVALYKTGETGSLQLLFSADSVGDWLGRVSTLRQLIAHDRSLLDGFRKAQSELEDTKAGAGRAARERAEAVEAVRDRVGQLARERGAKRDLLASLQSDAAKERLLVGELEEAARALQSTLRRMDRNRGRRSASRSGFPSRKGSLPAPLDAPVRTPFGLVTDENFGTQTFRKGIEFDAEHGAGVRAVALGEVRYADWFRGYGKIVILDHGEGYFSVSGHLGRIDVRVGQWVNEGEVIGLVGETGSLSGPGLYFELRKGRESLDPARWLVGRSEGLH